MQKACFKTTALTIACLFSWMQVAGAQETQWLAQQATPPQKPFEDAIASPVNSQKTEVSNEETSQAFLSNTLTLSKPDSEIASPASQARNDSGYAYERYEFVDAVEELRPEYASAVIVKDIKEEDLKTLTDLSFETSIQVIHGEIVVFTSGSEDEVGVLPAVKALTDKSTFNSHVHPSRYSTEGPSGEDINEAVKAPGEEYVITHLGVYAYNNEGLLNDGKPYSLEWYIHKIHEAVEASKEERNQVEARKDLNQFIVEQDRYNQASEEERITFRRGGTLTYTAGLTSSNITTFSGSPFPYITVGSTAATTLAYDSNAGQFSLNYSVPNTNNLSGLTISFDNANTSTIEYQDLSTQTYLTFGIKGPAATMNFEIVDNAGAKDTFTLTNISNTEERFWRIPVASISNTLNKTKIKVINFIVRQNQTTATARTGMIYLRTDGLNTDAPAQPAVTTTIPAATNKNSLTISGTKEANTSILINGTQVVAYNRSTSWSAALDFPNDGSYTFDITAKNAIGKISTIKSLTILRDTVVPEGVIDINSGATYALSRTVTLNLSATDASSGMDKMSFSTNNSTWSSPEAYATSKSYTLPSGDGSKTVYVKYYDKAGNISVVYSKSIILDTVAPTGTIKVNGGAAYINQRDVTLNLTATDAGSGVDKMSFSTNNSTWTTAEAFATTKVWTFSTGDGNKTVYVKFLDKVGRWSRAIYVTVTLDTVPPSTGSIDINSGALYTSSQTVTLSLSAADSGSGIGTMSFSTDGTNWSTPEAYATSKSFDLPSEDGNKTVYVKYFDKAGNTSNIFSKSILLDTTAPDGWLKVNNGDLYTNILDVTLTLSATDAGSGIDKIRFSADDGQTWGAWEEYTEGESLTLPSGGDGAKPVRTEVRDKAGNVKSLASSITFDATPPEGSVVINNGDASTTSRDVTLTLTSSDATSGVNKMRFSTDGGQNWTEWESAAASKSITLPAEDGLKEVFYQIRDNAGNVATLSDSIILNTSLVPPVIEFSSASIVTDSDYTLTYKVDGVEKQKTVLLKEGANLLSVEESNGTQKTLAHYLVILNALPAVHLPNKDLSFDFSLANGKASLYDPLFRPEGDLEGGWVKVASGTYYLLINGNVSEEYQSDGTRIFYDEAGRVHSKVTKDLKIANFTYEFNADAQMVRSIVVEENQKAILNSDGFFLELHKADGTKFFFDNGKLQKIISNDGTIYQYSLSNLSNDDYKSEVVSPELNAESKFPKILIYDSANHLKEIILPNEFHYYFDISGFVVRVTDADGLETNYDFEFAAGLAGSLISWRNRLRSKYASDGKLCELADSEGTIFSIHENRITAIRKTDGIFYEDLAYDVDGNLQDAKIHILDGRTLIFKSGKLVQVIQSDGQIFEFENDKVVRSHTPDNRTYIYSEEVDDAGNTKTVARLSEFINQNGNRVFVTDGRVSGIEEKRGSVTVVTTYKYDAQGKVIEADISWDGSLIGKFFYDYQPDGSTQVKNKLDTIRYYDSHGILTKLITAKGEEYHFSFFTDVEGNARILQTLARITDTVKGVMDYIDGRPVKIVRPDSISIRDIVLQEDGSLKDATVDYPDGSVGAIEGEMLKLVVQADGTRKEYAEGLLQKIIPSGLDPIVFTYTKDAEGAITTIKVEDTLGARIYDANGVLQSATKPDGTLFEYDSSSGNISKITTPAGEEFRYSSGQLDSIYFSTGESLTDVSLDGNGNIAAGTFHPEDGSQWIYKNGILDHIVKADGTTTLYYRSSGVISDVILAGGQSIQYSSVGKVQHVVRLNSKEAFVSRTTNQDALVDAIMDFKDGFTGVIPASRIDADSAGKYPLVNGVLKTPGSVMTSLNIRNLIPTNNDSRIFTGNLDIGLMRYVTGFADPAQWYGVFGGPSTGTDFSNAGYLKIKIGDYDGGALPTKARFQLVNMSNIVVYTKEYDMAPHINPTREFYFEIPAGLGPLRQFRLTFPLDGGIQMFIKEAAFYTRADSTPTDWINMATPFVNQKQAPNIPDFVTAALSKKPGLESDSQTFKDAQRYDVTTTSEEVYSVSSIKQSVLSAALPSSEILDAVYDTHLNLISISHRDPAFDAASDPEGDWKIPVSGWEEEGFQFAPLITSPDTGTVLEMNYDQTGSIAKSKFQGNTQVQYQNNRIETVLTPEGKTLQYQYQGTEGGALEKIIIQPDIEDAQAAEIVYQYDKIRQIWKGGVLTYEYSYEFDEAGNEITVIKDVIVQEIRRFKRKRLISVYGITTGFTTTYNYDASERVTEAVTSRAGRVFGRYTYTYEDTDTIIRDQENGILRRYGVDGILKQLVTSKGEIYNYSSFSDGEGEDLILQELTKIVNTLNGSVDFLQGKPVHILTPDDFEISDLVLNPDNTIKSATVNFPISDGRIALIENSKVIHITAPGGIIQKFSNGFLEKYQDAEGNVTELTYEKDDAGNISKITIKDKDGTRVFNKDGVLLQAVLPDTTQIDYEIDGEIKQILPPQGHLFKYQDGKLDSVAFAPGYGKLESIKLKADGSLDSGIYTKGEVVFTIQNGIVIKRKESDGTIFEYDSSGGLIRITETDGDIIDYNGQGKVMHILRSGGKQASNINTNSQDELVDALLQLKDNFSGIIPTTSINTGLSGIYPLINGILKDPGTAKSDLKPSNFAPADTNGTAIFTGDATTGFIRFSPTSSANSNQYVGVYGATSPSGGDFSSAGYLKVTLGQYDNAPLPTTIRLQLLSSFNNVVYTKDYDLESGMNPAQDVYFEIPANLGTLQYYRLLFPIGNGFQASITGQSFYSRDDYTPSDWIGIAKTYLDLKAPSVVPPIIADTLALLPDLETKAGSQFLLPKPSQIDQGQAALVYNQTQAIVNARLLDGEAVIVSAYRKSDGELVMAARADNTVAHYTNGKIDKVDNLEGELLIDYKYDEVGDLTKVDLLDARRMLQAKTLEAQNEIARQKEEALMTLAIARGQAVDQVQTLLDEALAEINSQRQELINQSQQKVCRKILFFKVCQEAEADISGPMQELDRLEREARDSASQQLADLDAQVATEKEKIEQDALTALAELEKQRAATYQEIVKQELRPVVSHYYRTLLGRDPSKEETDSWIGPAVAAEQIDTASLASYLRTSEEYSQRSDVVANIKVAVRDFLKNQYVPANSQARSTLLTSLGLRPEDAIVITEPEIDKILNWLDSRDLHFGHSAFFAIQQIMQEADVSTNLYEIAREAILIDILTGVIHPLTSGDLEISLYALQKVAANRGVSLTPAKINFDELKRELENGKGILVHISGNHYVVVTKIEWIQKKDDAGNLVFDAQGNPVMIEKVTYQEKNVGPAGEAVQVSKEEFLSLWAATPEAQGIVLTPIPVAPEAQIIDQEGAKQITGANYAIIIGLLQAVFTGIVAVITAVVIAVVVVVQAVIFLVASIVTAIAQVVLAIGKALITLGKLFFAGVKFISEVLLQGLASGFSFLKEGIAQLGKFLFFPGGAGFAEGALSPAQLISRQILGIALSSGSGKILEKLGVSPSLSRLATAFITGGVIGLSGGTLGTGTSFVGSALKALVIAGVNELALHINLPPPLTNSLAKITGVLAGLISDPVSAGEFIGLASDIVQEFAISGMISLADTIGLKPPISDLVGNLIGIPVGATLGYAIGRLGGSVIGYRDDGTPIEVSNPLDSGGVLESIKLALVNRLQVGFDLRGASSNPFFGLLTSSNVLNAVGAALNSDGLFSGIFNLISQTLLSPFNLIGSVVQSALSGVKDFGSIIQEKGIAGALESLATSIFSAKTLETILQYGSVAGLLGAVPKKTTQLLNNQTGEEYEIDSETSLYFDLFGNFLGKKENGVTQFGTFGVDANGKWGLLAGKLVANLLGGLVFAGEINDGQLMSGTLSGSSGALIEFHPEDGRSPVIIKGPDNDTSEINVWNMILRFLPFAMDLFFDRGFLKTVNVQTSISSGAATRDPNKLLYLLVNGVNNTDRAIGAGTNEKPHYYLNLSQDLHNIDNNISATDDVAIASIYPNIKLPGPLKFAEKALNRFKDVLLLRAEADVPFAPLMVVADIISQLGDFDLSRPLLGLGYSGGFAPMLEAINDMGLKTKMIAGVGAATVNLAQISDTLHMLTNSIFALENERVVNQNGDDFVKKAKDIISTVYDNTVGRIPILGALFKTALEFLFGTIQKTIDWVAEAIHAMIDMVGKVLEETRIQWLLSNQALFGLSKVDGADGVLNIFGDRDLLVDLGIAGKMSNIAGYSSDRVLDIEIKSYTDPSGLEAIADHYTYMRDIRNYNEIDSPAQRYLQQQFDLKVADFVARLLVRGTTRDDARAFLSELQQQGFVDQKADGTYEFYPFGAP